MRVLEPTCADDRGLAWSGMTGRSWDEGFHDDELGETQNEQDFERDQSQL